MSSVNPAHKGYQTMGETIGAALGTLAANTVLQLQSTYGNTITRTFLLKKFECLTTIEQLTSEQGPILVGLANGTASVAEIKSALEDNNPDPDDATSYAVAANRRMILWQSLHILDGRQDTKNHYRTRIGARGKGIPIAEDTGVQVFAYNADSSALTTGASIRGYYMLGGVWLND